MIKSAIVGCGNIAGFLDTPKDDFILTHAHAYSMHKNTHLIACCDSDAAQCLKFCNIWDKNIHKYHNLQEMIENEQIDMLSICSPTTIHAHDLKLALKNSSISTIICEKPFVQTQKELHELLPLLNNTDKKVIINFMRRYDPSIQKLAILLKNNELGSIEHFSGNFTKGLYHNGSHMLELIEYLCGKITLITALKCIEKENDLLGTFYLETTQTRGTLSNEAGNNYALFELNIILSKGSIHIKDAGHCITIETIQASNIYANYHNLKHDKTLENTMRRNIYNSVNFAIQNNNNDILQSHLELSQKLLDIKENLLHKTTLRWKIS